jgi:energy-coupling factor transporter ATP-binding protein EcfA2
MAERSKGLIEVGYYLSKFGISNPPSRFGDVKWNEVYRMFYDSLGLGRSLLEFEHSLKNTRDGFDGYFSSTKREGWKDKHGNPAKLSSETLEIFDEFQNLSEEEIFERIKIHLSPSKLPNGTISNIFVLISGETKLSFNENLISRFISSLLTKPFVILTGLSGSGKTKLAQAFAMWMSESKEQYAIVPVGADWTNREPLLGYPNSLKSQHYVKPDSGVLDILLRAHENYIENNKDVSLCKPYFLILDEMNLSHVERYFADFLSAMESGDEIKLYSGSERYDELDASGVPIPGKNPIPNSLVLPKNLFIIGTVNIDETTYMFSPKVLDRANTIEFRISTEEMAAYLENHKPLDMDQLLEDVENNKGKGAIQTEPFMALAARKDLVIDRKKHQETFVSFFKQLQRAGTEFGYRTANEMTELVSFLNHFSVQSDEAYDIAIMQKLLPKLNGSRSKLSKVLPNLGALCLNSGNKEEAEQLFNEYKVDQDVLNRRSTDIKFKLSFEKLCRMNKNAQDNGFASYAEA